MNKIIPLNTESLKAQKLKTLNLKTKFSLLLNLIKLCICKFSQIQAFIDIENFNV